MRRVLRGTETGALSGGVADTPCGGQGSRWTRVRLGESLVVGIVVCNSCWDKIIRAGVYVPGRAVKEHGQEGPAA